jgi:hypothetical protein
MSSHPHLFLGTGHARNERRAWAVIVLCTAMRMSTTTTTTIITATTICAPLAGLDRPSHVTIEVSPVAEDA